MHLLKIKIGGYALLCKCTYEYSSHYEHFFGQDHFACELYSKK